VSEDLAARGLAPLDVRLAGRGIVTEDLLELVHSGALRYTMVDRYEAELWAEVLDGLRPVPEVTSARGGRIAWAVRPDAPLLKAMLDEFVRANKKGTLIGNVLFKRYFQGTTWVRNPRLDVADGRLEPYLAPLRQLAEEYGFDWIELAAQVYQESRFDPRARSGAGAVGLMQLLPATARDMGVEDLEDPEQNLLAGVRYMDWLRRSYFSEPGLSDAARFDFCLAAYNAGPGRVKRWRAAAPGRGLDPDRWFGSVEQLALEDVGMQPVRYVANIQKYALILRLVLDDRAPRSAELEELRGAAGR
jgi:membrane-bound lytic murein transglycosylase MltF